jgi:4'-phosphopantetheinyl transferase
MPQISSNSLNTPFYTTQWMIWEIKEELPFFQTFPKHWLTNIKDQNKAYHKTIESSAARFCLWQLCENMSLGECNFQQDERDRPYFLASDIHISLSHSFPFVAAIICKGQPVGIDLERYGRNIEKIGPRFLSQEEWRIREHSHQDLTQAWTCKEAVYKAMGAPGLSFQQDILLPQTIHKRFDIKVKNTMISLQIETFEKFACAIAMVN